MSEPSPKEYAYLYIRGVNEAAASAELEARDVLDVLDVFGDNGLRWYLIGRLEGMEDREEAELEEYEMLESSIAFVVHESSVSILEESEDTLEIWMEDAPKDLSTEVDLHIVDDEDILHGGRIVSVEFEDPEDGTEGDHETPQDNAETLETAPATITVEKWKYKIVEYSDPDDWPGG